MSTLTAAFEKFNDRWGDWITAQPETVALSAALAFGQEYQALQDALTAAPPPADAGAEAMRAALEALREPLEKLRAFGGWTRLKDVYDSAITIVDSALAAPAPSPAAAVGMAERAVLDAVAEWFKASARGVSDEVFDEKVRILADAWLAYAEAAPVVGEHTAALTRAAASGGEPK